jgi:hypothetical protein
MNYAKVDVSTSGDSTIVAAVPERKIRVITYVLASDTNTKIKFKSASNDLTGPMAIGAYSNIYNGNTDLMPGGLIGVLETEPGEALVLNSTVAAAIGGHIVYKEIS